MARDVTACEAPAFVAVWDRLAEKAGEPNPFHESWSLLPALRTLDPGNRARILCLERDGALLGLIPIVRSASYYGYPLPHLRNWSHDNSFYGAPLVARGKERAFWRALLDWCDRQAGAALFLHLMQMPASGLLHRALSAVLQERNCPAATVLTQERALLASDLAPADYYAGSLSAKKRKELQRQHRRLSELGALEVVRERGTHAIAEWTEQFLALEARGWKGRAGSSLALREETAALFARSLAGAAGRGRLERLALLLNGRPIAMLATFLSPPGAFSYKTAYDEAFARFSPGVLLQREALELIADPAIDWIDSCAAPDHAMIDHIWRERRQVARHSIAIGGPLRRRAFSILSRRETGSHPRGLA